jgi:catalase
LDRVVDNFFAETEQVAFCAQNIVPGIDFTNDPLLQGRNFSYLDTQVKRLGGPNFTQIPINAPKCPFAHFQQDGHMTMTNPTTRASYEPNSWGTEEGGPREDPTRGFTTFPAEDPAPKRRLRPESFADHYSQARQFYLSQTDVERGHIADAFVFELSKCERPEIRERMPAGLRNVDDDLARDVLEGLGLERLPTALPAARKTMTNLPPSPTLSILANPPRTFAGRKLGVLVTEGADATILAGLRAAAKKEGANVELIAPTIAGVLTSDGKRAPADQKIDGAPSVLYDAIVVLASEQGATRLAAQPAARDFVSDAFAHCKLIGYANGATGLFNAAGLAPLMDDGFIELSGRGNAAAFLQRCREPRVWDRQAAIG